AAVNSNVGIFTCVNVTVNGKGLVTAAANGGCLLLSGGTMTGELITKASATGGAGLNIPPGTAPTSPVNGDCWTTTLGLYCQINGSTVGPFGTGGGATGANPTATAGPTAINGSSLNFMRADAAPAVQKAAASTFGIIEPDGQTMVCPSGVCSTTASDVAKTASYTIAATDMGGQVNFNGSSLTVTIPAISSTVLAAGMSVTITNINSTALTISTTPTINGFNGTSIPQFGGINCVSNGTSLDCIGLGVLANQAFTNVAQTYSAPQRTNTETPAISTSTFTPVFSTGQNHRIVLVHASCPCTLANPAALVANQSGMFEIVQSATGSDTIGTWGSEYQYAGGTSTITLSTGANAVDYLPYYVDSTGSHIVLGGIIKGPAH